MLPRLAICGTVRNAESSLRKSLLVVDKFRGAAASCTFVVVTNDNEDDTVNVLRDWSCGKEWVTVIRCHGLVRSCPNRVDRLALARNMYMCALRQRAQEFDLLLVLDLDGVNEGLDPEGVADACGIAPDDWAGLFPNQRVAYYDLYALRHRNWVTQDVWTEVAQATAWFDSMGFRVANKLMGGTLRAKLRSDAVNKYVHSRQYRIPPGQAPIQVDSAFGGLGVYRYSAIASAWYGSRSNDGTEVCEHVAFNDAVTAQGGKLYICPSFQNLAPTEHLGPGSGAPFPTELLQ
jgi:hypothetical protein